MLPHTRISSPHSLSGLATDHRFCARISTTVAWTCWRRCLSMTQQVAFRRSKPASTLTSGTLRDSRATVALLATPSHLGRLPPHEKILLVIHESRGYCLPALSSIPNSQDITSPGPRPLDTNILYAIIFLSPEQCRACCSATDMTCPTRTWRENIYIFCKRVIRGLRLV